MQSLPVVLLGFLLGMLHATDADHVIAVSTIVSRQGSVRGAARVGMFWGLGHSLTLLVVGSAIVVFDFTVAPQLELAMELCVAFMLMGLGIAALSRVSRHVRENFTSALAAGLSEHAHAAPVPGGHLHPHTHGDYVHVHAHAHASAPAHAHAHAHDRTTGGHGHAGTPLSWLDRHLGGLSLYQALRPLAIGIVHGLAGSAAVALLVLAQIRDPIWALPYLLMFATGTVLGMMLITSMIAVPFVRARRLPSFGLGLQMASGALSLGLGCYLAWRLGFDSGLFVAAIQIDGAAHNS